MFRIIYTIFLLVSFIDGFGQASLSPLFQIEIEKSSLTSYTDSAIFFANKALEIARVNKNGKEKGFALYYKGKAEMLKSDYLGAGKNFQNSLKIAEESVDIELKSLALLEIGKCYQLQNKHADALKNYLFGLEISEKMLDSKIKLRANIYLAEYYRNLAKLDKASYYINHAFAIAKLNIEDDFLLINLFNRAAAIKSELSEPDSSLYFSKLALSLSKKMKSQKHEAVSLNEIGYIYECRLKFKEALVYYNEAHLKFSNIKSSRELVNILGNQGRTYSRMGSFAKSNQYFFDALEICEANKYYSNIGSICALIQLNYINLGDKKSAYYYESVSLRAQLEAYKQEHEKEIIDTESKYKSKETEIKIKEQKKEIENARLKVENQKNRSTILIYGILGLCLLILFIVYVAFQRTKANSELKEKNIEIADSNLKLNQLLKKSEVLLQEVHHRVKNNLQFISSILELEIDANKKLNKEDSLDDMSRRITAMSLVHELLYNQDNLETVPVKKYITELMVSLNEMVSNKHLSVKFDLKLDDVMLDVKQCVAIGMIISELVSNSIKHAFKNQDDPIISIELREMSESSIRLYVADNGSGYSRDSESQKGMGSRLVHIFTNQLNGKYKLETNNGFSFTFEFPLL